MKMRTKAKGVTELLHVKEIYGNQTLDMSTETHFSIGDKPRSEAPCTTVKTQSEKPLLIISENP